MLRTPSPITPSPGIQPRSIHRRGYWNGQPIHGRRLRARVPRLRCRVRRRRVVTCRNDVRVAAIQDCTLTHADARVRRRVTDTSRPETEWLGVRTRSSGMERATLANADLTKRLDQVR